MFGKVPGLRVSSAGAITCRSKWFLNITCPSVPGRLVLLWDGDCVLCLLCGEESDEEESDQIAGVPINNCVLVGVPCVGDK